MILRHSKNNQRNKNGAVCPETGRLLNSFQNKTWLKWLFPISGLIATIWFFIRVIPKPSRATYPCQRIAFPLASSFVAHITGICVTIIACHKAKHRLRQARYALACICILVGITSAWLTLSINSQRAAAVPFVPPDSPNSPVGAAKGIRPGRVVWVHDPNATNWDGSSNYYWNDTNTDQAVVDQMFSNALRWLTGELTDEAAWDAIFRYFNKAHDKGNNGYRPGEKIIIKPNHVEQRSHDDNDNNADVCPQVTLALIRQLVYKADIEPNCITLCDPSRFIADKTYNKCFAEFPQMVFEETTFYNLQYGPGTAGRISVNSSDSNMIYYSAPTDDSNDNNLDRLPTNHINAAYLINLAILKGHYNTGVTLCGKNLYGSPSDRNPVALHNSLPFINSGLGQYRAIVDLMGHEHVGGKTLLYLLDGLYGSRLHNIPPEQWSLAPFSGDFSSSLFVSQDPVAIDSVGLDFLRSEWNDQWNPSNGDAIDDYLHEAALANDPCSNTLYDPHRPIGDQAAARLPNLGVHEHWNDSTSKHYTRNLGTGDGIELVSTYTYTEPLIGNINADYNIDAKDLAVFTANYLNSDATYEEGNLDGIGPVNLKDFAILSNNWGKHDYRP